MMPACAIGGSTRTRSTDTNFLAGTFDRPSEKRPQSALRLLVRSGTGRCGLLLRRHAHQGNRHRCVARLRVAKTVGVRASGRVLGPYRPARRRAHCSLVRSAQTGRAHGTACTVAINPRRSIQSIGSDLRGDHLTLLQNNVHQAPTVRLYLPRNHQASCPPRHQSASWSRRQTRRACCPSSSRRSP